jgi:hypothetical protein
MAKNVSIAVNTGDESFDDSFEDDIALATGSSFPRMEDIEGCLLLMRPYEQGTRQSKNGDGKEYPWVECDVVVLQAPGGEGDLPTDFFEGEDLPFELEGFQFTGQQVTSFLIQKMKRGKRGLGVLVKGVPSQRGRNAPWVLEAPTAEQVKLAKDYARAAAAKAAASNPWE